MSGVLSVERSYPALGSHVCGIAWDGYHLWHADAGTDRLYCLDVHTGTILREVACPEVRTGLTYDGTSLWQMAGHPSGSVSSIQPMDRSCGKLAWGNMPRGWVDCSSIARPTGLDQSSKEGLNSTR